MTNYRYRYMRVLLLILLTKLPLQIKAPIDPSTPRLLTCTDSQHRSSRASPTSSWPTWTRAIKFLSFACLPICQPLALTPHGTDRDKCWTTPRATSKQPQLQRRTKLGVASALQEASANASGSGHGHHGRPQRRNKRESDGTSAIPYAEGKVPSLVRMLLEIHAPNGNWLSRVISN